MSRLPGSLPIPGALYDITISSARMTRVNSNPDGNFCAHIAVGDETLCVPLGMAGLTVKRSRCQECGRPAGGSHKMDCTQGRTAPESTEQISIAGVRTGDRIYLDAKPLVKVTAVDPCRGPDYCPCGRTDSCRVLTMVSVTGVPLGTTHRHLDATVYRAVRS